MGERCLALNSSGAEPSVAMRLCGRVYGHLHLRTGLKHIGRSPGGENGPEVSPLYGLKYSGTRTVVCCSDLVGGHGSMK
jgi:hypothetical protein